MPGQKKPVTKSLHVLTITEVRNAECRKAFIVLEQMHKSCQALFSGYRNARYVRNILTRVAKGEELMDVIPRLPRGMTTDEEQDLLRSMLVMAASGLDAMLKQLIRDALPSIAKRDLQTAELLEKFIQRAITGTGEKAIGESTFLARILMAPSTRTQVIEEYVEELTKGSLQSVEELLRVAAALGIKHTALPVEKADLREAFGVRNQVIHELDINLEAPRRNRNVRKQSDMLRSTNHVVEVAEYLLKAVDDKINQLEAAVSAS